MVAFKYRWLAAFLPFIDIKKAKSIISVLCLRIFQMKKQTHYAIFQVPATNQLGLLFSNCMV